MGEGAYPDHGAVGEDELRVEEPKLVNCGEGVAVPQAVSCTRTHVHSIQQDSARYWRQQHNPRTPPLKHTLSFT